MQEQPAVMMNKLAALTKNVLLAHGKAVRVLRSRAKLAPKIGMALNGSVYLPENESPDDIEKAAPRCSRSRHSSRISTGGQTRPFSAVSGGSAAILHGGGTEGHLPAAGLLRL